VHNFSRAAAVLLVTAACTLAFGGQKKDAAQSKSKPAGFTEQVEQLSREYEAWYPVALKHLDKLYEEAKPVLREDRTDLTAEKPAVDRYEKASKEFVDMRISYGTRLLELARKRPKDPAALIALKSVLTNMNFTQGHSEALKMMTENHAERAGIGEWALRTVYRRDSASRKFAEEILHRNKNREDQAKALYALALGHRQKAIEEGEAEEERAKAKAAAEILLERLRSEYADIKLQEGGAPLGKIAEGELAGLKNLLKLVVGKEALEIDGVDLEGKVFKLSDYRGKVVLLDFWAHW
jgi:hypothetical protein